MPSLCIPAWSYADYMNLLQLVFSANLNIDYYYKKTTMNEYTNKDFNRPL